MGSCFLIPHLKKEGDAILIIPLNINYNTAAFKLQHIPLDNWIKGQENWMSFVCIWHFSITLNRVLQLMCNYLQILIFRLTDSSFKKTKQKLRTLKFAQMTPKILLTVQGASRVYPRPFIKHSWKREWGYLFLLQILICIQIPSVG